MTLVIDSKVPGFRAWGLDFSFLVYLGCTLKSYTLGLDNWLQDPCRGYLGTAGLGLKVRGHNSGT